MKKCIDEMMKDKVLSREDKLNMLNMLKSEVKTEIKRGRGSDRLAEIVNYIDSCIDKL